MAVHGLCQWCICKMSDPILLRFHRLIYNSVCQVGQSKPDGSSTTKTHYLEFTMKHLRLLARFLGLGCRCFRDALRRVSFAFHADLRAASTQILTSAITNVNVGISSITLLQLHTGFHNHT